nr:hypothetical protein Iba_scaffold2431CG0530 [Ipomoea batatas]
MDLYRGCEDFCDAHGLQEDDVLIFRHVEQLDLPEAHGDGIERQPAEDGEAIFVPTMSSINLDVGLTTLSGCRTLAIDFIEFCNDESILTNFIFWTESKGDTVDVRHGTFTLTFINVGELINYGEQHAFLRRILCRHRNVIRYLVFFNYEVGEEDLRFEKMYHVVINLATLLLHPCELRVPTNMKDVNPINILTPIMMEIMNIIIYTFDGDVFHNVLEMLFGSIFVAVAAAVAPVRRGTHHYSAYHLD